MENFLSQNESYNVIFLESDGMGERGGKIVFILPFEFGDQGCLEYVYRHIT